MVIKIYIYIFKEGYMVGKFFIFFIKKIIYNNGIVFIKKIYLEEYKIVFFFNIINIKLNISII